MRRKKVGRVYPLTLLYLFFSSCDFPMTPRMDSYIELPTGEPWSPLQFLPNKVTLTFIY